MPTKVRLSGAASRAIRLATGSSAREITITFAEGEELPAGDLYATATYRDDTITLTPYDVTGSDGIAAVQVTVAPEDFEEYGSRTWQLEVGTLDAGSGSGSGDDTAYVMFYATVNFREIVPSVIDSTTVEETS
jgi:hypothetical protein